MTAQQTRESITARIRKRRQTKDRSARRLMIALTAAVVLLLPLIAVALFMRSRSVLAAVPLSDLVFGTEWNPTKGSFGFLPFILGTVWVTVLALIIAVPPSLLTAIYLAEYAKPRLRALVNPIIDLLAGIPSVVYGVWGVLIVVPFVGKTLAPALDRWLGVLPLFRNTNPTGYNILSGSLVLAVMVFPFIIAVGQDVIYAVPQGLREASLALGATRWQTVRRVVFRRAWPGILAAIVLGLSRAFGETMAVLMVVGNVAKVPHSIFDPAYPLPALIANNYGEMMSYPNYEAALMAAALILLLIVLAFNLAARAFLVRWMRSEQ
jgi:phosphate transport system permease protein